MNNFSDIVCKLLAKITTSSPTTDCLYFPNLFLISKIITLFAIILLIFLLFFILKLVKATIIERIKKNKKYKFVSSYIKKNIFTPLSKPLNRKQKILVISIIITIGFISALIYNFIYMGFFLHKDYPFNTFLFIPADRFNDFIYHYKDLLSKNEFIKYPLDLSNPPFPYLLFSLFFLIKPINFAIYAYTSVFIFFFFFFNLYQLKSKDKLFNLINAGIWTFLSYPFLFLIDRGNLEIFNFIFLYFFILFINKKNYLLSTIFLAACISLKTYPFVLLILFLLYKKYRYILFTFFSIIFLNLFSFLFLLINSAIPLISIDSLFKAGSNYNEGYVFGSSGLLYSHSLFNIFKVVQMNTTASQFTVNLYFYIAASIFLILFFYIFFYEKGLSKRISILIICMLLLPFVSTNYRLLELFILVYLFINAKSGRNDLLITILFALLLIPKNYFFMTLDQNIVASWDIVINPLLLVFILFIMLDNSLLKKYKSDVIVFFHQDFRKLIPKRIMIFVK